MSAKIWNWMKAHKTQLGAVVFWVMLVIALRQYMTTNDLTFVELTRQLAALLTETWYGPLIYIVIYLVRPLILFPASLLTILAGNVYGLFWGMFWGLLAGTASAVVPYAVGRWFSNDNPENIEEDQDPTLIRRLVNLMKRNPFQSILTMRLIYLPYDTVSLIAGAVGIKFISFFLATLIGNIFGTFAFVGIGASVEGDITAGEFELNPVILIATAIVWVVSIGISRYLKARQNRLDAQAEADAQQGDNRMTDLASESV